MKAKTGAINPPTGRAAQPSPISLPPERQLQTTLDLEEAVTHATAIIDLLAAELADRERAEVESSEEPPWLSAIRILAFHVGHQLDLQFAAHLAEVRRLQYLGL